MPDDLYQDLHFPKGGIDLSKMAMRQPWRPGPSRFDGEPTRIYTCADAENVRAFDPTLSRFRGGSRIGLKKWSPNPVIAGWLIQHLNTVVGVEAVPLQGSSSGRVVTVIAICQGRVFWLEPADDPLDRVITEATNNADTTPPMNFNGIMRSTPNNQKLYLVDGLHYRFFVPVTNTVENWTALQGYMPSDSTANPPIPVPGDNLARLCATWRGRIVLSGIITDGANWFMSAVGHPRNFDYSPISQTPEQAVAGNNSRLGLIGDQITALMAYNDDELIFGEQSSLYIMRGDPMIGGEIDLITSKVGVAFGEAFTQDSRGVIYFMSNTGAIYAMPPKSKPERISVPIDRRLQNLDMGAHEFRLEWDEVQKGFNVFITSLDAPNAADRHYFWEQTNGWQPMRFGNKKHNPMASCVIDGNNPSDRVVAIGSADGFIRVFDPSATTDDGTAIESYVLLGPFLTKNFDEVKLKSIQAVLGKDSGDVNYAILYGRTAEEALVQTPVARGKGVFGAGRSMTQQTLISGYALYIKLSSTNRWAIESIRAAFSPNISKIRMRA